MKLCDFRTMAMRMNKGLPNITQSATDNGLSLIYAMAYENPEPCSMMISVLSSLLSDAIFLFGLITSTINGR